MGLKLGYWLGRCDGKAVAVGEDEIEGFIDGDGVGGQ